MNMAHMLAIVAACGMGGLPMPREFREPEPKQPKQLTKYDLERIAKARAKMERKAERRRAAKEAK